MSRNDLLLLLAALGHRLGEVEDQFADIQLEKGDPGPPGPPPKHEWDDTRLRFERADGTWGDWVDLQGPAGERRIVAGGGGFNPDALPLATGAVPNYFLVQQAGEWRRATYSQMRTWFPGGGTASPVTVNGAAVTVNGSAVTVL